MSISRGLAHFENVEYNYNSLGACAASQTLVRMALFPGQGNPSANLQPVCTLAQTSLKL